jgi:transcriptional regulator with XRE-family HTH domain
MPIHETDRTPGHVQEAAAVLGRALRERRKMLGINATAAAEAAGVSRVTWHRLEKGEPTVALGSWLAAARVLGMVLPLPGGAVGQALPGSDPPLDGWLPLRIRLDDYPQLRRLAWQVGDAGETLSPREAVGLYGRNWRHVQPGLLEAKERALIDALREAFGDDTLRV